MKKENAKKNTARHRFIFKARLWKYKGPNGWHFVTLSKILSKKIRKKYRLSEEGWGRLKSTAQIGEFKWETAIWFDTKHGAYLLPIRSPIRKAFKLQEGSLVKIQLTFHEESCPFLF